MNDDIVLLQPLEQPIETSVQGNPVTISYGIDGTENNFYAMPFGLDQAEDPITFEAIRGTKEAPNTQEILENVPVNVDEGTPNFLSNPVRNMRVTLSRPQLVARKGSQHLIEAMTDGRQSDSVHVPMQQHGPGILASGDAPEHGDTSSAAAYAESVHTSTDVRGGRSDGCRHWRHRQALRGVLLRPISSGWRMKRQLDVPHPAPARTGGLPQEYYVFNTGGVGADTNEEASGSLYKKIPRELTLMLQEALLREAVKFEHDSELGSDIAVAIVDAQGRDVLDLRSEWLPHNIYSSQDYTKRMLELSRRRYYSRDAEDKGGHSPLYEGHERSLRPPGHPGSRKRARAVLAPVFLLERGPGLQFVI